MNLAKITDFLQDICTVLDSTTTTNVLYSHETQYTKSTIKVKITLRGHKMFRINSPDTAKNHK